MDQIPHQELKEGSLGLSSRMEKEGFSYFSGYFRGTGGSYRPLFNSNSRVPGAAALLVRTTKGIGGGGQQTQTRE